MMVGVCKLIKSLNVVGTVTSNEQLHICPICMQRCKSLGNNSILLFRLVYKWFYLIYKVCCFVGVFGYILMMLTMLGVNLMFGQKPQVWMDIAILFLFNGLYFGVLGRDVAEYCTDQMAASIGVSD